MAKCQGAGGLCCAPGCGYRGALAGCVLRSPSLGQPDTRLRFQSEPPGDREKASRFIPQLPKFHPPAHPRPLPGNTAPIPAPLLQRFRTFQGYSIL